MIFVTVGQEKFPFDRLLRIIDEAVARGEVGPPVFGQTGCSGYRPKAFPYVPYVSLGRMKELIRESRIVVTHGGTGSIVLCFSAGKIPVVVPREKRLGEHVDDHQAEFAAMLEAERRILVAHCSADLIYTINNYEKLMADLPRLRPAQIDPLVSYLTRFIEGSKNRSLGSFKS
jgi:UDP-N-acetylglucosamine transferase subunit ALG13